MHPKHQQKHEVIGKADNAQVNQSENEYYMVTLQFACIFWK